VGEGVRVRRRASPSLLNSKKTFPLLVSSLKLTTIEKIMNNTLLIALIVFL
jgi:hypothetical protein